MKTDRIRTDIADIVFVFIFYSDSDLDTDSVRIHIRMRIVSVKDTNNEYRIRCESDLENVEYKYLLGY
jgi:hypothetical protein